MKTTLHLGPKQKVTVRTIRSSDKCRICGRFCWYDLCDRCRDELIQQEIEEDAL